MTTFIYVSRDLYFIMPHLFISSSYIQMNWAWFISEKQVL